MPATRGRVALVAWVSPPLAEGFAMIGGPWWLPRPRHRNVLVRRPAPVCVVSSLPSRADGAAPT